MGFRTDHDNTGVLWLVGRKISNESSLVNAVVVFYISIRHMSRSCFTRHREWHVLKSWLACTYFYHRSHTLLCSFHYFWFTNFFFQYSGLKLIDLISIDADTINQVGLHHLSIIRYRVVKRQCIKTVSYTHLTLPTSD